MMKYKPQHAEQAVEILERLLPRVSPRAEYFELIEILKQPKRWKEAHGHFFKIRVNITIPLEAHKKRTLDERFACLAENAAKTAYNCSGESDPFDNDSFARLLKCQEELSAPLKAE